LTRHSKGASPTCRKIVVGYDAGERAKDALALGKLLADASDAELMLAGVFLFDPVWGLPDSAFREAQAGYARALERAAESVGAESQAVASSSPARGLHDLAEQIGADLVVVGSSQRSGAGQVLAGNIGLSLLHGSPCSVAVAPRGYADSVPGSLEEIVVGYDGSQEARLALADATELALTSGALVKLVAAAEPPVIAHEKDGVPYAGWYEHKHEIERVMRERLTAAVGALPDRVRVEPVLVTGVPAALLADLARADGAVLLLGSRAYGPLRRVLLGTVASALVRTAPCPIVVHPRGARAASPDEPVETGTAR
jgi:nucleotide-binding universal stress UspA family protein